MDTVRADVHIKLRMVCPTCDSQVDSDHSRCPVDGSLLFPEAGQDPLLGAQVGSYLILEELGQGSSGQVYLAKSVDSDMTVAIKVLKCAFSADPAAVKRFQQEAQALIALNHQDIPAVYDFGLLSDSRPFIVMEYVRGKTLTEVLKAEHRLDPDHVIQLFTEIADALNAAHQAGILHRDLKPSNIIIDQSGNTKIVDFGLAKISGLETSTTITRTGVVQGTPAYMSPEQCYGRDLDARSDVYSLGCVLYECLTGIQVFPSTNAFKCMHNHVFTPPPPVSELVSEIPIHLEALILNCLEKEPERRLQSMSELRTCLLELRGKRSTKFAYLNKSFRKLKNRTTRKNVKRAVSKRKTNSPNRRTALHPLGSTDFSRMIADGERRLPLMLTAAACAVVLVFAVLFTIRQGMALSQAGPAEVVTADSGRQNGPKLDDVWIIDPWKTSDMKGSLTKDPSEQARLNKLSYEGLWLKDGVWLPDNDKFSVLGKINLNGLERSSISDVDFPAFAAAGAKNGMEWYLLNDDTLGIFNVKDDEIDILPLDNHLTSPSAITYDTRRNRAVMLSAKDNGKLYTYKKEFGPWAELPIGKNDQSGLMRGLAYRDGKDQFYSLRRSKEGDTRTYLCTINGDGKVQKNIALSKDLCSMTAWSGARVTLSSEGEYLIATLCRTNSLHEHDMVPRMFVIDPANGKIVYARPIASGG